MKQQKLKEVKKKVQEEWGFRVVGEDLDKPWGAYFVIHPEDTVKFVETYFSDHKEKFQTAGDLSPKYLIVEGGKRLSWQVHERRGEIWKVVEGPVGAFIS